MEAILLDTMFELPALEGVREVGDFGEVVTAVPGRSTSIRAEGKEGNVSANMASGPYFFMERRPRAPFCCGEALGLVMEWMNGPC